MDSILLIGSEDVQQAGNRMHSAAQIISASANQIDNALAGTMQFLNDWMTRFENTVTRLEEHGLRTSAVTARTQILRPEEQTT